MVRCNPICRFARVEGPLRFKGAIDTIVMSIVEAVAPWPQQKIWPGGSSRSPGARRYVAGITD